MSELEDDKRITFVDLPSLKRRRHAQWMLHRAMMALCTSPKFSWVYRNKLERMRRTGGIARKALSALLRYTPKVPNSQVNGLLHSIIKPLGANVFPSERILAGSLNASPELLCAPKQRVFTIMESWDHPAKIPAGYRSYRVFVWNESFAEEWRKCQGDRECIAVYPFKLRYAIEELFRKRVWESRQSDNRKPLCVYAVATTRLFGNQSHVALERRIIDDVCKATREAGWDLLVKPRPNGDVHEFDDYLKSYGHVRRGYMRQGREHPSNYYFDEEYDRMRFDEVLNARMVVNAFTTFGLDAAVAGMPVLQLDIRRAHGYADSESVYRNPHIQRHLINRSHTFRVENVGLTEALAEYLRSPTGIEDRYSEDIRRWLMPGGTVGEGVERIVEEVLS